MIVFIQMVDDILSDNSIERLDRIDRIDSILAAAHALNSFTPSPKLEGTKVDAETQVGNLYIKINRL